MVFRVNINAHAKTTEAAPKKLFIKAQTTIILPTQLSIAQMVLQYTKSVYQYRIASKEIKLQE